MSLIAFYAPMKPPCHPVPSGDRQMARALMTALGDVDVASTLRTHDKTGDQQAPLLAAADDDIARILATPKAKDWAIWVTYHNYYKAPDLIGPAVCDALGIPYVQIEATRARKRLGGPWHAFAERAEAACDRADTIFYLTDRDRVALETARPDPQSLVHLRPFLPQHELPDLTHARVQGRILSAGMMRPGDKHASYALIAEAMPLLQTSDWALDIAGDGPDMRHIRDLFAEFGERVRILGQLDRQDMTRAYQTASAFFWPGVNEAFGMVYLEAQANGAPIVAQDRPGVRDILADTDQPQPASGAIGLAQKLDAVLSLQGVIGTAEREHIRQKHLMDTAIVTLRTELNRLTGKIL